MFLRFHFRLLVLSGIAFTLLPLQAQITSQGGGVSSSAPTLNAQGGNMSDVLTLRQKEQQLLDQLMLLQPTDADYNKKIRSIGEELRTVQNLLLGVDNTAPESQAAPQRTIDNAPPATLRSRASVPQSIPAQTVTPLAPTGRNTPLQINSPNGTIPYASLLPTDSSEEPANLNETEPLPAESAPAAQNGAPVNITQGAGTLDAMNDPELLQQIKEELTFQLKQIQDVLASLGPQDQALAESFKLQRGELLQQLMEINDRLGQTNGDSSQNDPTNAVNDLPPMTDSFPDVGAGLLPFVPEQNTSVAPTYPDAPPTNDAISREEKLREASGILRDLGLTTLADQVLFADRLQPNSPEMIPNLANPQWYNPEKGTADEVKELRGTVEAMSVKIDQMANDIKDLTAQIKLLTRQATSAQ